MNDSIEARLQSVRADYWRKGYAVLRGVFGASRIQGLLEECRRLWQMPGLLDDLNLRSECRRDLSGNFVVDRLDPVLDLSSVLLEAVSDPLLMAAISRVLGGHSDLLKCKLIRKDPGTGGYAHHQDFLYWRWLGMHPDLLCSAGIPLFPCGEESGGIELFPGYHGALLDSADGDPDRDFDLALIDTSKGEIPTMDAGDVLIFHSLAPHRSGPNRSGRPRTLLLPSYALTPDRDLYARYYRREITRRVSGYVGFERYDMQLAAVCAKTAGRSGF